MAAPHILVSAAEASGDLLLAGAVREIRERAPEARLFGMGGEGCRAAGVDLLYDAKGLNVMGIWEVLPKIPRALATLRGLARAAEERRADLALLVDSPDFNLRLARRLARLRVPVVYYVSPTVWAWRRGRIETIRRCVKKMLVVLPFEEDLYRSAGVEARYVGHPLLDTAAEDTRPREDLRRQLGLDPARPVLALLPGSRRQELRRIFPAQLAAARALPEHQVVVPVAPTLDHVEVEAAAARAGVPAVLVPGRAAEVLRAADAAVVASGTATLEAALARTPMVVVYKLAWLTYWIGLLLIGRIAFSLVNIIAQRSVVPELLQREMAPARIAAELRPLVADGPARRAQLEGFEEVRRRLGAPGASGRVAEEVLALWRATSSS